jgi:1-deoxy-D-xylulose-5-phosphate reductoisomerase
MSARDERLLVGGRDDRAGLERGADRPEADDAAGRLDFRAPDETRFPALRVAREAGRTGQRATTALIAADDVAVERFLDGSLGFTGIPALLEAAVERFGGAAGGADQAPDVDALIALDAEVRGWARTWESAR